MKKLIFIAPLLALSACAEHAAEVQPTYVSKNAYSGMSCSQMRAERSRIVAEVQAKSAAQDKKAQKDEIAMAAGMILFWPALFALSGNDDTSDLASAKGNHTAIDAKMLDRGCKFS